MPLSIDSIYKPMNDFFLDHFKTSEGNPVMFRFARIGKVISDGDFVDLHFPDQYSAAKAREYFSDLVNCVPVEDPDKQNIFFTQNNIDELYRDSLLGPSIPFLPADADELAKASIIANFSNTKNEALKDWEQIKDESTTGLMMDYRPSLATPENWFDKSKDELWTPYEFHMEESSTPATDNSSKFQLWKLRLDDTQLINALPQLKTEEPLKTATLHLHKTAFQNMMFKKAAVEEVAHPFRVAGGMRMATMEGHHFGGGGTAVAVDPVMPDTQPVQLKLHKEFWDMDVRDRVLLSQYIKTQAPTKPVSANNFSINFRYCVIDVNRPWLKTSFLNDKTWSLPGMEKGKLSAPDNSGGTLPLLPIGFVAIKDLSIEANWSGSDIDVSKQATDFGPFQVDPNIVNNKISHAGIQIVGWIVQRMPDLPPNNAQ